jgi:hypothetical protein
VCLVRRTMQKKSPRACLPFSTDPASIGISP